MASWHWHTRKLCGTNDVSAISGGHTATLELFDGFNFQHGVSY